MIEKSKVREVRAKKRWRIKGIRASLVVQWLRIFFALHGTWVRCLVREDSTCCKATKPVHHNYWACALESMSCNYQAHVLQLLKAIWPRTCALQQEKSLQWEARVPQWRLWYTAPTRHSWRKSIHSTEDPAQSKINKLANTYTF